MQTRKGKKWFRKTLSKVSGIRKWNYVCFVAFPNLENRDVLTRNDIIKEREEILVNFNKSLFSTLPKFLRMSLQKKKSMT